MKKQNYYLGLHDWEKIEQLSNRGATAAAIADKVGAHTATIYNELQKGYEEQTRWFVTLAVATIRV